MGTTFPSTIEKRLCFLARQASTWMTEGDSKMAKGGKETVRENAGKKTKIHVEEQKNKKRETESESKAPSPCSGVWRQREK